jgi:hypothetical protein
LSACLTKTKVPQNEGAVFGNKDLTPLASLLTFSAQGGNRCSLGRAKGCQRRKETGCGYVQVEAATSGHFQCQPPCYRRILGQIRLGFPPDLHLILPLTSCGSSVALYGSASGWRQRADSHDSVRIRYSRPPVRQSPDLDSSVKNVELNLGPIVLAPVLKTRVKHS